MNREILFRGKRTDNGEWVYGFFWKDIWGDGEFCYILYDGENYPIIPAARGEYTGLTDKNGVKIFEGDILRFINTDTRGEWLCTVEFHEGAFIGRNTKDKSYYCHFDFWNTSIVQWEVIGNIHDTPELLEGDDRK